MRVPDEMIVITPGEPGWFAVEVRLCNDGTWRRVIDTTCREEQEEAAPMTTTTIHHRYDPDTDRCVCGGLVVYYNDDQFEGYYDLAGEGCEVQGHAWDLGDNRPDLADPAEWDIDQRPWAYDAAQHAAYKQRMASIEDRRRNERRVIRLEGTDDSLWLILPTENLRRLVQRHYPRFDYVLTWNDVNGYGLELADTHGVNPNRHFRPRTPLDPRRLP